MLEVGEVLLIVLHQLLVLVVMVEAEMAVQVQSVHKLEQQILAEEEEGQVVHLKQVVLEDQELLF